MRMTYGALWKNDSTEALQVWANALARYNCQQVAVAMQKCLTSYIDFPPTLPQFLEIIREPVRLLPGSVEAHKAEEDKIFAYTKPLGPHNPEGNPSCITLHGSVAVRRQGEAINEYRLRISNAVTIAKYPASIATGTS